MAESKTVASTGLKKWMWVRVGEAGVLAQIVDAGAQPGSWKVRFADDSKSTQEERELPEDQLKKAY